MSHDYQSILSLMNVVLVACAGITGVGLYRIFKRLGCMRGQTSKVIKNNALDLEMILSSMPRITYNADMPNKEAADRLPPSMPAPADTAWVPQKELV